MGQNAAIRNWRSLLMENRGIADLSPVAKASCRKNGARVPHSINNTLQ